MLVVFTISTVTEKEKSTEREIAREKEVARRNEKKQEIIKVRE